MTLEEAARVCAARPCSDHLVEVFCLLAQCLRPASAPLLARRTQEVAAQRLVEAVLRVALFVRRQIEPCFDGLGAGLGAPLLVYAQREPHPRVRRSALYQAVASSRSFEVDRPITARERRAIQLSGKGVTGACSAAHFGEHFVSECQAGPRGVAVDPAAGKPAPVAGTRLRQKNVLRANASCLHLCAHGVPRRRSGARPHPGREANHVGPLAPGAACVGSFGDCDHRISHPRLCREFAAPLVDPQAGLPAQFGSRSRRMHC